MDSNMVTLRNLPLSLRGAKPDWEVEVGWGDEMERVLMI